MSTGSCCPFVNGAPQTMASSNCCPSHGIHPSIVGHSQAAPSEPTSPSCFRETVDAVSAEAFISVGNQRARMMVQPSVAGHSYADYHKTYSKNNSRVSCEQVGRSVPDYDKAARKSTNGQLRRQCRYSADISYDVTYPNFVFSPSNGGYQPETDRIWRRLFHTEQSYDARSSCCRVEQFPVFGVQTICEPTSASHPTQGRTDCVCRDMANTPRTEAGSSQSSFKSVNASFRVFSAAEDCRDGVEMDNDRFGPNGLTQFTTGPSLLSTPMTSSCNSLPPDYGRMWHSDESANASLSARPPVNVMMATHKQKSDDVINEIKLTTTNADSPTKLSATAADGRQDVSVAPVSAAAEEPTFNFVQSPNSHRFVVSRLFRRPSFGTSSQCLG